MTICISISFCYAKMNTVLKYSYALIYYKNRRKDIHQNKIPQNICSYVINHVSHHFQK